MYWNDHFMLTWTRVSLLTWDYFLCLFKRFCSECSRNTLFQGKYNIKSIYTFVFEIITLWKVHTSSSHCKAAGDCFLTPFSAFSYTVVFWMVISIPSKTTVCAELRVRPMLQLLSDCLLLDTYLFIRKYLHLVIFVMQEKPIYSLFHTSFWLKTQGCISLSTVQPVTSGSVSHTQGMHCWF